MTFENVEPGTYYFKEVSSPVGKIVAEWTTGDSAQIGLFAILSIAAIVVVIIVLRRRKNS